MLELAKGELPIRVVGDPGEVAALWMYLVRIFMSYVPVRRNSFLSSHIIVENF
jgi:hypothetical protein